MYLFIFKLEHNILIMLLLKFTYYITNNSVLNMNTLFQIYWKKPQIDINTRQMSFTVYINIAPHI